MNCNVRYEDIAAYTTGDLPADTEQEVARHLADCENCRARVESLQAMDSALGTLARAVPPASSVMATRRAVAQAVRETAPTEIMTLEEVAHALRLSPEQLADVVDELPAFELAGQVRVRRSRLDQWVQERERAYVRETKKEWLSRESVLMFERGVA